MAQEANPPGSLNRFERNLEVWRQLWRTTEVSDVLLFVVRALSLPALPAPVLSGAVCSNLLCDQFCCPRGSLRASLRQVDCRTPLLSFPAPLYEFASERGIPVIVALNKSDLLPPGLADGAWGGARPSPLCTRLAAAAARRARTGSPHPRSLGAYRTSAWLHHTISRRGAL